MRPRAEHEREPGARAEARTRPAEADPVPPPARTPDEGPEAGPSTAATRVERETREHDVASRSATDRATATRVSVVVPVMERPAPLDDLYREYAEALRAAGYDFEFVFAARPWFGDLLRPVEELEAAGEPVTVLRTDQALGEASLLRLGMMKCTGDVVLTLPPYHRVTADTLPVLVERVRNGADMALARRWPRRDSWVNRLQSRAFHFLLRGLSGQQLDDVACGVRAGRREVLQELPLYGDFFRFLPLFAQQQGYRVEQVDGVQHPEDRETRVYSPGIYLRRMLDLLGVFFLLRFTYKPLRFFGLLGGGLSLMGGAILCVLLVQRLGGQPIADRPLLLLGVLIFTLGIQAVALGLVGELIVHYHMPGHRTYRLDPETADDT